MTAPNKKDFLAVADLIELSLSQLLIKIKLDHPNVPPNYFLVEMLGQVLDGMGTHHTQKSETMTDDETVQDFEMLMAAIFGTISASLDLEQFDFSVMPVDEEVVH